MSTKNKEISGAPVSNQTAVGQIHPSHHQAGEAGGFWYTGTVWWMQKERYQHPPEAFSVDAVGKLNTTKDRQKNRKQMQSSSNLEITYQSANDTSVHNYRT